MKKYKGFIAGMLTMLIIVSLVGTASATLGKITKELEYRNIKVSLDGEILDLTDSTGSRVEPFMMDGTNYLPVRALAEALGLNVSWDGQNNTIKLSSQKLYNVVRVIDGDTIVVDYNGIEETVRLIGVDTPESVHPDKSKNSDAGRSAAYFTTTALLDLPVELEFDVQERDQYGRLLAYVYVDGKMFNKTLLEVGYANVSTYPPNVKYVNEFTEIVKKRNSELPPKEYCDIYMKAPSILYEKQKDVDLTYVPMYEVGTVSKIGELKNSDSKYFNLHSTQGDLMVVVIPQLQNQIDSLKVGDTIKVGFTCGNPETDSVFGVYTETLEVNKTDSSGSNSTEKTPSEIQFGPIGNRVYITKTGKKYHYSATCNGGKYIPSTLSEARARGLTPCEKCVG